VNGKLAPYRGFTLIELMISLVIGIIVISAGFSLYLKSTASRSLIQAEVLVQENSYFINQTLRQLLNQAGYRPLTFSSSTTLALPIESHEEWFPEIAGSFGRGEFVDAVTNGLAIRFAGSSGPDNTADGTMVNCQGEAIARDEIADITLTVAGNALTCTSGSESVELLSEKDGVLVERIAVLWGIDTDNDNSVDVYQAATGTSEFNEDVLAVQVLLLLSSKQEVKRSGSSYVFNGENLTSSDKRIRRQMTISVQIKN